MATAELVADALIRAADKTAMPAGVFNMIYGGGVGEWLVKHPAIQAVGFTGSLKGGRRCATWPLRARSRFRCLPRCRASTR
jgi:alpha-ketoglutaric semialdehyde dehydrogenase